MKRRSYKEYALVGAVLLALLTIPTVISETIRTRMLFPLANLWRSKERTLTNHEEVARLEGENHLLRIEIGKLRALIDQQQQAQQLAHALAQSPGGTRRYEELAFLLSEFSQAIPARVIYRDPGTYSTCLWVDVGSETNKNSSRPAVQKNSPVVVGRSLVGVVDYVGRRQSRVRLISDMTLKPSVRAIRGSVQNVVFLESLDCLLRHLHGRQDLPMDKEESRELAQKLEQMRTKFHTPASNLYLAKGIVQGASTPLWRNAQTSLRGIGFNYDTADQEGGPLELISSEGPPILQPHDILMTTGMDGVFPPGLRVAEVIKVFPLREGAYTFDLEATPLASPLSELQTVFILPPLGFDPEEHPNLPGF